MTAAASTWRRLVMAIGLAVAALLAAFLIVEVLDRVSRPVLDSSWAGDERTAEVSMTPRLGRGDFRAEP